MTKYQLRSTPAGTRCTSKLSHINHLRALCFLACILGSLSLPAQIINRSPQALDSIVSAVAAEEGLPQIAREDLPVEGAAFWEVYSNGLTAPLPLPLCDPTFPIYQVSDHVFLVDGTKAQVSIAQGQSAAAAVTAQASSMINVIAQMQEAAWERQLAAWLGIEEGEAPETLTALTTVSTDTNGLWLEMTGTGNGLANVNLHHGTNWVYALWTTTNLLTGWQVETEVWPWDGNCQACKLPLAGRQTLFVRAEDWTWVDSQQHGVPDWWQWYWFGAIDSYATNEDDLGNTFWLDFATGLNPNVISFSVAVTNNYVNQNPAPVGVELDYGRPSYYAVLVDDTNLNHAVWQTYTGPNLGVNLGTVEGWHEVRIGLRGHADTADAAVWAWNRLKLEYSIPQLVVTNPFKEARRMTMDFGTTHLSALLEPSSFNTFIQR